MSRILPSPHNDPPLPNGWYLLWCEGCDYSVSFTEADAMTYVQAYEWAATVEAACEHECLRPAAAPVGGSEERER